MSDKTFAEILDEYRDQHKMHSTEGSRGFKNLCKTVHDMGYKDPFSQLYLSNGACVGDLMVFLEDNPGAIQALYKWMEDQDDEEWTNNLESQLVEEDASEDELQNLNEV